MRPSRLFLRVYLSSVIALVAVTLVAYFTVESVYRYRLLHTAAELGDGPIRLLMKNYGAIEDPDLRKNFLEFWSRRLEGRISVMPVALVRLDMGETPGDFSPRIHQLSNGRIQIIYPYDGQQIFLVQFQPIYHLLLTACMDITRNYLLTMPPGRRQTAVAKLNRRGFSLPLVLSPWDDTGLHERELERLRYGQLVTQVGDQSMSIYASIGQHVLRLGPVRQVDLLPGTYLLGVLLTALVVLAVVLYGLTWRFEKKLRKIRRAASRLASGDMSTTFDLDTHDTLGRLAQTLNRMSERIRFLLDTQREMIRAVSHELRTPVARIRFAVEMMVDLDDAEKRAIQHERIDRDIDELDDLIEESLVYARLDAGQAGLDLEPGDLVALASQVAEEQRVLAEQGTIITLDSFVQTGCPQPRYDHRYIHRALQNLVSNARRYCRSRIHLFAEVTELGCRISVEDDGPGVPEDKRATVFMPFSRLDDSRARASGGHGLGLSIVRRVMDWHGGKARVLESTALGGARFVLYWPLTPSGVDNVLMAGLDQRQD
jgi:two-component system sensor histidine kinase RstB